MQQAKSRPLVGSTSWFKKDSSYVMTFIFLYKTGFGTHYVTSPINRTCPYMDKSGRIFLAKGTSKMPVSPYLILKHANSCDLIIVHVMYSLSICRIAKPLINYLLPLMSKSKSGPGVGWQHFSKGILDCPRSSPSTFCRPWTWTWTWTGLRHKYCRVLINNNLFLINIQNFFFLFCTLTICL